MSYILEALKKAQAERQLGNAPTIHAPQPVPAAGGRAAGSRKPLLVGVGAGVFVVAIGGVIAWRAAGRAAAPATAPVAAAPTAAPSVPPANAPRPAVASTLDVSAPAAPAEPPPRPQPAAAPARATPAAPATPAPAAAPVAATAAVPPAPPVPVPGPEDSLPYLQQLPDTIQRDVPRVSFGGYMYSANPADRLLLVDKALRHEGEEVAPGLVLEKLLPKAAVMNFRGVRYRVPY